MPVCHLCLLYNVQGCTLHLVFLSSVLRLGMSNHSSKPAHWHSECVCYSVSVSFQFDDLGILRTHFFQVIRNHNVPEDTQERFDILRVLTLDGKNILHLEQDVGEKTHHKQDGWHACKPKHGLQICSDYLFITCTSTSTCVYQLMWADMYSDRLCIQVYMYSTWSESACLCCCTCRSFPAGVDAWVRDTGQSSKLCVLAGQLCPLQCCFPRSRRPGGPSPVSLQKECSS